MAAATGILSEVVVRIAAGLDKTTGIVVVDQTQVVAELAGSRRMVLRVVADRRLAVEVPHSLAAEEDMVLVVRTVQVEDLRFAHIVGTFSLLSRWSWVMRAGLREELSRYQGRRGIR